MNDSIRKPKGRLLAALLMILLLSMAAMAGTAHAAGRKVEKVHPLYYAARMTRAVRTGGRTIPAGVKVTVTEKGAASSTVLYQKKSSKVPTSAYTSYGLITRGSKRYSNRSAENFVNQKGYRSKTGYLVWVSTYTQHLYVFKGQYRRWKVYKHIKCATGRFEHETPLGVSFINSKMPWLWFNQSVGQGGYYGLRIRGGAIHSWLYNIAWSQAHGGKKLMWNKEHYGKPVSSGCVRVTISFAKWMYDKIPLRTTEVTY